MIGLTWDAIDFEKRTLTVNKTLEYRHKQGYWRAGPPKTQQSYRTIPFTTRAYNILQEISLQRVTRKKSETLSQVLAYIDRKTGKKSSLVMKDIVFITGEQESLRKTAPTILIFTRYVTERISSVFVCTHFTIHTPQEPLKAVCNRKYCKSC